MKRFAIDRSLRGACMMIMLLSVAALADPSPTPGTPDTNASDQNYDTTQPNSVPGGMEKAKDASNRGMNKVDNGVHKAGRKTRRHAHKAKRKAHQVTQPA